ncbi:MAG: radical SAM protein [Thermoanaerobaculia bacterium]
MPPESGARRKVVLYNPRAVFFTLPLGLVAVGSHLDPSRYEVVVVDARLEKDPVAALLAQLPGALCLGVTVLTGAPIRDAIQASRAAKAVRPDLPVVWGGWHPSLFGTECLEESSVDATVQGQGEETFAEILARLEAGESLEGCAGCCFRAKDGAARANPGRAFAKVAGFRRHDYSLLPLERYFALKGKRQLDYVSSQGCHFRCSFCADPFVFGRSWAGFEPARVGEELEAVWKVHRFDDVNFQDETFFTYAERVEGIARELVDRKLNVSWAATMRADQGDRLPEEAFALCRRSGLRRVLIGVESGSQEMMDRIRKDIRREQVFRSAEKCLRHGIAAHFPFILCFPGETDESIRASLDMARELRAMSPGFETPLFYFRPYPGTPLTAEAVAAGYPLPKTLEEWADFDFYGASPWVTPEREALIERYRFYQRFGYAAPRRALAPLQRLARWRCERSAFGFPLERAVANFLFPPQALS